MRGVKTEVPTCPICGKQMVMNMDGDLNEPTLCKSWWECPDLCELEDLENEVCRHGFPLDAWCDKCELGIY